MDLTTARFTRTRIAPTPSGYLHLGNILSFVITIGLARKTGASILLRIDDMDQVRVQDEYLQDIFDTLHFLELPWDEGPTNVQDFKTHYSQVHRLPLYQQALKHLQRSGALFACTCSRSKLQHLAVYPGTCIPLNYPLDTPRANWRLHTLPQDEQELPDEMRYFVVRKKDGMPAYQLTSVIDDLHFGVDLVVRGNDLWPSTKAQFCLANHLQPNPFSRITFFHHPLITDAAGNKLSKSAGATSIQFLRRQGLQKVDIYKLLHPEAYDWQSLAARLEYLKTSMRR